MPFSRTQLVSALKSFCAKTAPVTEEDFERKVSAECIKLWEAEHREDIKKNPTLLAIPRIFVKKEDSPNSIAEQIRREARIRILKKQELLLLEQEDLELCHELLALHATPSPESPTTSTLSNENDCDRINYDGFCQVRAQLPEKFEYYFSPSTFLRMKRDEFGRIGILPFYQFVVGRDALLRKRITLGWYDYTGSGYLREVDLNNFVQDEISNSPILSQLGKSFQAFYICTGPRSILRPPIPTYHRGALLTRCQVQPRQCSPPPAPVLTASAAAVRYLLFFLDPARRGKARIRDMIRGPHLDDLLALRQPLPEESLRGNWFAPAVAERVYRQYTQLDADGNGMLAPAELLQFPGAYLTEAFVERVFEECQTYRVEGHPELQAGRGGGAEGRWGGD